MTSIFFDLSELFLSSRVKFKYYGIARTVMEVGCDLKLISPGTRYVIYSPAHQRFYEVFPKFGEGSSVGTLDLNLPASARPLRLRQNLHGATPFKTLLYRAARRVVDYVNTRRWGTIPEGAVREIDLDGQVIVSLGRPKLMSDFVLALKEKNIQAHFVPLLHDMIPLYDLMRRKGASFSQSFLHDNRAAIDAASLILTNSEFTKAEILRFSRSGLLPPTPEIVPIRLCSELRDSGETVSKKAPDFRFILCVGTYNGRKNLECVVEAMLLLHMQKKDVPALVLAGARRKRVVKFLKQKRFSALKEKFHFVQDPNQAELKHLYERAYALINPSRMEGWGLPVSEALWCGTPALASDIPALREAGGELALYFNPEKPDELASLLETLLSNPAKYGALKRKIGQAKPSMRTWSDVARGIVEAAAALGPTAAAASTIVPIGPYLIAPRRNQRAPLAAARQNPASTTA